MPRRLRNRGNKKAAVSGGEDRLSALLADVIRLLLSLLRSRQAVQMSVLGPRWRTLWKSLPSLRIDMGLDHTSQSFDFINSLIRYRDPTPLRECEILSNGKFTQDVELCLRYAVSCKVRDLRIKIYSLRYFQLSAGTFFSAHLTRLFLKGIWLDDFYLHVSSCQSLEELDIKRCDINIGDVGTDFPKSLRLLRIRKTNIDPDEATRSFVSAPGLVTLELAVCYNCTPWLKSMPSLVTAFIKIGHKSSFSYCEDFDLDDGLLLKGLSGATNLELISLQSMVFRKEIKCYPTFSKLKTLLLSDWCMTSNFTGLVYFLQHSPILERFMLQLGAYCKDTQMHEVYPKEQFMLSKHLKAVEITFFEKDVRVDQIVNFLAYHGVHPKLINIERKPYNDCFSFERKQ